MNALTTLLLLTCLTLASCGGSDTSVDPPGHPMQKTEAREKWEKETQAKFNAATAAIERSKSLVANIKPNGRAELVSSLTAAQAAIQDVAQKQKDVSNQFSLVFIALDELQKENARLSREKKKLEEDKSDLQARERLFSMGFYTSLGAAILAIAAVLTKLPTAFLDRKYRKLELLEKRIEIRKLRQQPTTERSPFRAKRKLSGRGS